MNKEELNVLKEELVQAQDKASKSKEEYRKNKAKLDKLIRDGEVKHCGVSEYKTYKLNRDKIKSLDDVIDIIEGLNITVTLREGEIEHRGYNLDKLLKYMD